MVYPILETDLGKLRENLATLKKRCQDSCISLAVVVKGCSAHPEIVKTLAEGGVSYIASSRMDQIKRVADATPDTPRMLLRVAMLSELPDVVTYADASLHSEITVLRALNEEARKQGKIHEVMLMADMGDLREGFWDAEECVACAVEIEEHLKNLRLIGVGTNLNCYGSIMPEVRNMQGLVMLGVAIEKAIGRPIDYISGGGSTSVYLVYNGQMPFRMNFLRLGELVLVGQTVDFAPKELHTDVFTLKAQVVECKEKPSMPVGKRTVDAFGKVREYEDRGIRKRALIAVGRVDYCDPGDLFPRMKGVEVLGASSDHTILDVTDAEEVIRVGDILEFDVNYASLVYLTSTSGVAMTFVNN
ncbi:MAG: alanine/ornithine racemase family PLP-dependent enzyme [Lachnospiraceae bacterium]|nr:alanine/ornithine racemase family PLP-dependent enzyme [Lachnospiraceae bacterium]